MSGIWAPAWSSREASPLATSRWWSRVATLCAVLVGVLLLALHTWQAERVRDAFETEAEGGRLQLRLREIEVRNRREFYVGAGAAGVLLGGFCTAMWLARRARARARREAERFRRVAEGLPQLVWTWTPSGSCDYLSRRWLDYTGRDEAEQLAEGWRKSLHPEDLPAFLGLAKEATGRGEAFQAQVRLIRRDGAWRWFDVRALPLLDEDGRVGQWLGSATDIQRDRELLEAAGQERNFSNAVIDSLPGVFYLFDQTGKLLRWNRNFERVTGYGAAEIAGMHPLDFIAGDDKSKVAERIADVFQAGESAVEADFVGKNGGATPYFFTGVRTLLDGRPCLVGVGIDITERRRAEQEARELNAQLERRVERRTEELAAKNRELEMFTYSVSHDLKAPLRGIDGYSRLLLEDHADRLNEDGRRFLAAVRQASVHMGQLIDDLLAYSRLERRVPLAARVRLGDLTRSLLGTLAGEIETRGVRIANLVPPEAQALADPQALTMALRNLLDNALKFTRDTREPSIEIGARVEGANWVLWVKDNGIGFDMRFLDRIFEIFQRLHRTEDYPGTGIGLAIVRKAMERMGGTVRAEGTPGRGAVFFLELPLFKT